MRDAGSKRGRRAQDHSRQLPRRWTSSGLDICSPSHGGEAQGQSDGLKRESLLQ